jgi:predicted outer membrane protein
MLGRTLPHMLAAVPFALMLSSQGCDSDRADGADPRTAQRAAFLDGADGGAPSADPDGGPLAESDAGDEAADAGNDAALGDAEIAAVLHRLNALPSEQGALALTKAASVNVAAFGAKMESQYLAADRALTALLASIGVDPQPGALSLELTIAGQTTLDGLRAAVAPEFDPQYLLAQIAQFPQALSLIDALLPQSANPELRAYMQSASGPLMDDLREAQQLLEHLGEE